MDDKEILGHIDELIETEHELRAKVADGSLSSAEEQAGSVRRGVAGPVLDLCDSAGPGASSAKTRGHRRATGARGRGVHAVAAWARLRAVLSRLYGMPGGPAPDGQGRTLIGEVERCASPRFAKGGDVAYGVVGETRTDGAAGGRAGHAARWP